MARLFGTNSGETINGSDDDDLIAGKGGDDVLNGGGGNDGIDGGLGDNLITGGDGDDRIRVGDTGVAFGDDGDDQLMGGPGDVELHGGEGDDDLTAGFGLSHLYGGAGDDILRERPGGGAYDGGDGVDFLVLDYYFQPDFGPLNFDFRPDLGPFATPLGAMVSNVEKLSVIGTLFDDRVWGGQLADGLSGSDGRDILDGRGGDDTLSGGDEGDVLYGGDGNDSLQGGWGFDKLYGGDGDDILVGLVGIDFNGSGPDLLIGGAGADTYRSSDYIRTTFVDSAGAVRIDLALGVASGGDAEGDVFEAQVRHLAGSRFGDVLISSDSSGVELRGLGGADLLVAAHATDKMTGGGGRDTFAFDFEVTSTTGFSGTVITDFNQALGEKLDLSAVDASVKPGIDAFTFIGTAEFTEGATGELRYIQVGGLTYVEMNIRGNTDADATFALQGVYTLTEADFVL